MPLDIGLLGNAFFTNVILPFILVFTVVFAILEKTEILGKKKDIHAVISFVISLIAIGVPTAVGILQKFIPIIAVIIIILFAWLLVFGFANKTAEVKFSEGLRRFFLIALGVVLLAVIVWAIGSTTGWLDQLNINSVLSAQVTQMVLFAGAVIAVIAIAISSSDHEKEHK